MFAHDKQMTLENGNIQVIVCTSAFGMGIDQPVVEVVGTEE